MSGAIKVRVRWDDGEAGAELSDRLKQQSALFIMDVLQDIISDLQLEYQKASTEYNLEHEPR